MRISRFEGLATILSEPTRTHFIRAQMSALACYRQVTIGLRLMAGDNARVSVPRNDHGIPMRRPPLKPMDCWCPPAKL